MVLEKKEVEKDTRTSMIMNVCMLSFVMMLMVVAVLTFFVALINDTGGAYSIASIYILCMLLVTASLKMFLDKTCLKGLKTANICGIVLIFFSILVVTAMVCISLAWPNLF